MGFLKTPFIIVRGFKISCSKIKPSQSTCPVSVGSHHWYGCQPALLPSLVDCELGGLCFLQDCELGGRGWDCQPWLVLNEWWSSPEGTPRAHEVAVFLEIPTLAGDLALQRGSCNPVL